MFFCRTERTSTAFSAFANFQSVFQNEQTTNNAEQKRTEDSAFKDSLNEIVRRTMAAKRTVNEQCKQHIYGHLPTLFGVFGEVGDIPPHLCSHLRDDALCGVVLM